MDMLACAAPDCTRTFLTAEGRQDHADAVHTFDDIRQIVQEELREAFGPPPTGTGTDPYFYLYIVDLADDWVVFNMEGSDGCQLTKVSYSLVDNDVTFGTPFEVVRTTVYVAAPPEDD